ncbi:MULTISPECIES: PhaM family polyhydroxyalkanoate granule multifunctional regulatory protein [Giesbergeria]|uniref:PhaM family polyhydroxyalkanoate granule multifunctional regulatory protein n=1 Tax=Giesbergeria sinuosa TaxID=80883 RepID=A0ABV9QE31_9BURK
MSDTSSFGFGNFLPGFDFLQNLTQGAASSLPQMPNMSSWIAPTISVEELEKRITELKAVQFWLEQNSRALTATIQALEVQKMTLATLKGMNFSMADMANAFTIKKTDASASPAQAAAPAAPPDAASETASTASAEAAPSVVDPMQWWGALTQQFQQIAATAMTEATKAGATDLAAEAFKTATDMAAKSVQTVKEATLQAATVASAAAQQASQAAAPVKKATARKAAPTQSTPGAEDAPAESDTEPRKAAVRRTKAAR